MTSQHDVTLRDGVRFMYCIYVTDGNHQRTSPADTAWFMRQADVTSGGILYIYGQIGQHYQGDIAIDDITLTNFPCT